jgi:Sel1 repeat
VHRSSSRAQALIRPDTGRRRPATARRAGFAIVLATWLGTASAAGPGSAPAAPPPEASANPISEPWRLWAFDAFALKPPSGGEWYSLFKSRDRVVFARRTVDPTYALIAVAHAAYVDDPPGTPEALVELVRARAPHSADTLRYEIKEQVTELEPSASWCVRYGMLAEDSRESFFYPRIIRIAGRVCAHPEWRGLLIDASYAERAIEGESRPEALEEGEAFIAGLRITPLHATAVAAADALITKGEAREAVELLAPLAEQGYAQAAQLLGAAYERGRGVAPDLAAANRWYRIAAEAGEVDALYNLGALYEHPDGGVRDVQEALRWFRRAADQRDAQAQLNLALIYLKGDGVETDRDQARVWLERAASNGNARARALLRKLFP